MSEPLSHRIITNLSKSVDPPFHRIILKIDGFHVDLHKQSITQSKAVKQSVQQALRIYCLNIYMLWQLAKVLKGIIEKVVLLLKKREKTVSKDKDIPDTYLDYIIHARHMRGSIPVTVYIRTVSS